LREIEISINLDLLGKLTVAYLDKKFRVFFYGIHISTIAFKSFYIQTPGNFPAESIEHLERGRNFEIKKNFYIHILSGSK